MKSLATRRWIRSLIQSWFSPPAWKYHAKAIYRLQIERLEDRVTPTTWTVLNANPTGAGSLFAAVSSANSDTSPALINFDPTFFSIARTITLPASLTLNNTSEPITIQGPTNVSVTISGNNDLTDVVVISGVTAFLQNLTFTQGNANGGNGGAVDMVGGTLSISNCTISSSSASSGGGLYVGAGNLILQNSLITNQQQSLLSVIGRQRRRSCRGRYGNRAGMPVYQQRQPCQLRRRRRRRYLRRRLWHDHH